MLEVLVAFISSCRADFGFVLEICLFTNLHSKIAGWLSSEEVVGCGHSVPMRDILSDSDEGISIEGCSWKFTSSFLLHTRIRLHTSLNVLPS